MAVVYFRDDSEALAHYGVKGMKWGVRKDRERHYIESRNGDRLVLERNKVSLPAKMLGRVSPKVRANLETSYDYTIRNDRGKRIGDFSMQQKPNREMNIVWGGVNKKYRGRGYMTAVMAKGEQIAKDLGNVKITGELVGNSPGNSIHKLASNRGYIKVGEDRTEEVLDAWGGLTFVEKRL